eukprot:scpid108578/ scgid30583/ S-phase kinase-associated protein 1; Cyclin-A/CDK2-associated protein p19; S-phase kinase-associated protein 1A; p19A; p19skp1 &gt; S-phase kinase-associated protein 1; Cyclin-A/CDK2-associated protein p19; S-phase kinase-associated protein 1A; p19A; p19skp1
MASKNLIKLESNDCEVFDVEIKVACQSQVIKTMLEDLGQTDDDAEPVPLPNVNATTLRKVIAWCMQHHDDTPVVEDNPLDARESGTFHIDSWDRDFLKVDQGTLFELIKAADYL